MTFALNLRINKTVAVISFLALIFALIYLIFIPHTFAQGVGSAKSGSANLKACQAKERVVKNRIDSLINLVTNQETKFSSIAARVENHYATKLLPKGEVLSNYNALVSDISVKKSIVDNDLLTAENNAAGFSCTLNPQSQLTTFRKDIQTVKGALKNYRTSIRNLIVALMTLEASPSPKGVSK